MTRIHANCAIVATIILAGCGAEAPPEPTIEPLVTVEPRPDIYAEFTLTADLSVYTENQRKMIGVLIEASKIMDDLYWRQAYGDDYQVWLDSLSDENTRLFAEQNYGMRMCLSRRFRHKRFSPD